MNGVEKFLYIAGFIRELITHEKGIVMLISVKEQVAKCIAIDRGIIEIKFDIPSDLTKVNTTETNKILKTPFKLTLIN